MSNQTTAVIYSKDRTNPNDTNSHFSVDINSPIENAFALACTALELPRADTSLMTVQSTQVRVAGIVNCGEGTGVDSQNAYIYWDFNKHEPNIDGVIAQINEAIAALTTFSKEHSRIFLARSNYNHHLYLCYNSWLAEDAPEDVSFAVITSHAKATYATCQDGEADPITRILGIEPDTYYCIRHYDYIPDGPNWAYIYHSDGTQYNLQGIDLGTDWEQWGNIREVILMLEEPPIYPSLEPLVFTDSALRKYTPIKRIPVNYGENKVSFHAKHNFDIDWVHFSASINLYQLRLRIIADTDEGWRDMDLSHIDNIPIKFRIMHHSKF